MQSQDADPTARMMQMITGYWVTQVVRGAAAVGLPEQLAAGPRTPEEISKAGRLHPDVASRFLRACVAVGLVEPAQDGRVRSTALLETLRDRPGSLRGLALAQAAPGHWLPWGRFDDVLASGRRHTVEALGSEVFDYYADHPGEADVFSQAMSGMTSFVAASVARAVDTTGLSCAVDIGGAEGALVRALLDVNAGLRGIVYDRPGVVDAARRAARTDASAGRIAFESGDFFASVPGGDLYLLKHILHDWDDESCLAVLRNCRRACAAGGRIVVVEALLEDGGRAGSLGPLLDLNMLVLTSGCERTLAEYASLLEAAGFAQAKATPLQAGFILVEAVAADR